MKFADYTDVPFGTIAALCGDDASGNFVQQYVADAVRRQMHLRELRGLRIGNIPAMMANPPKLSQTGNATSTIVTGETIANNDRRITYAHGVPVVFAAFPTAVVNQWITMPAGPNQAGGVWSQRFITDAPVFEMIVADNGGSSSFNIMVDGQMISRSSQITMPNAGGTRYIRVDFGADTQTIWPVAAIAAGGSGYATGDEVTIVGGTGAAMVLTVTNVNAGAITGFYIKDYGSYSVVPGNGAATTTAGAGTGATFNVTTPGSNVQNGHTTRRTRRIQVFGALSKIIGVRVPTLSIVRPWPVAGPRLFAMCDSYGDTFHAYPGGGYAWRIGQRLGIEDVWVNGRGGSGFLATNGATQSTYRQRLGDLAAVMPANPATPAILFTQASINDAAPSDAALQAEVQAYWDQAFAAYPNMFMLQTGIMRASGSSPADSKNAAVKAGFLASQAAFDPQGRRSAFLETRGTGYDLLTLGGKAGALTGAGNTDFWDSSDGAHPHQTGHDFIGDMLAMDVLAAMQTFQ